MRVPHFSFPHCMYLCSKEGARISLSVKQEVGAYSSKGKQDDPIQAGEARETPASYYSLDVISNGNSS